MKTIEFLDHANVPIELAIHTMAMRRKHWIVSAILFILVNAAIHLHTVDRLSYLLKTDKAYAQTMEKMGSMEEVDKVVIIVHILGFVASLIVFGAYWFVVFQMEHESITKGVLANELFGDRR